MSRRPRRFPWTTVKGGRRFARRPWRWTDPRPKRAKIPEQPWMEEPFCEIDAGDFERAKRDPRVHELHRRADAYVASLRDQGRLD